MKSIGRLFGLALAASQVGVLIVKGFAYLDPGSGSFLLQVLATVVLGALLAARLYWARLKTFFGNLLSRRNSQPPGHEQNKRP
jgi:hypothetical protein